LIHLAKRFYKVLHKQDSEETKESESKLSKQIKKQIEKALSKTERSRTQIKNLKQQLNLDKKAKHMLKFYKKEQEIYSGQHLSLDKSVIYE
jgi:phage-related protein